MDVLEVNKSNKYRHPWELSRRDSLLNILKRYDRNLQYADIGAGDLFFTKYLSQIISKPIYAVDPFLKDVSEIRNIVILEDSKDIPSKSIDFVLLLDVLEHIQDDKSFLELLNTKLKDGGRMVITVPAFQFLYSDRDKFLKHYRRYRYGQIRSLLENNFDIEESFYFYTTLFFMRLVSRFFKKKDYGVGNWKYEEKSIITRAIRCILNLDFVVNRCLNKLFIRLPGLSLCIICKKKSV